MLAYRARNLSSTVMQPRIRARIAGIALTVVVLLPSWSSVALAQEVSPQGGPDDLPPAESVQATDTADQTGPGALPVVAVPSEADIAARVSPSVVQVLTADGAGSGVSIAAG